MPYSTGAVCVIEGGIADNVVPADCRFHYEFRNLPGSRRRRRCRREVRAYAETLEPAMRAVDPPTPASASRRSARCRRSWPAPTIRPCCSRSGWPPADATTLVAFGTEAGLFQRAGIPTVVCGPGHIAQAHQADEYVSLAQLAAAERFLLALTTAASFPLAAAARAHEFDTSRSPEAGEKAG